MAIPGVVANGWLVWSHRAEASQTRHLPVMVGAGSRRLGHRHDAAQGAGRPRAVRGAGGDDRRLHRAAAVRPGFTLPAAVTRVASPPVGLVAPAGCRARRASPARCCRPTCTASACRRAPTSSRWRRCSSCFSSVQAIDAVGVGLYTRQPAAESLLALVPIPSRCRSASRAARKLSAQTFQRVVLVLLARVGRLAGPRRGRRSARHDRREGAGGRRQLVPAVPGQRHRLLRPDPHARRASTAGTTGPTPGRRPPTGYERARRGGARRRPPGHRRRAPAPRRADPAVRPVRAHRGPARAGRALQARMVRRSTPRRRRCSTRRRARGRRSPYGATATVVGYLRRAGRRARGPGRGRAGARAGVHQGAVQHLRAVLPAPRRRDAVRRGTGPGRGRAVTRRSATTGTPSRWPPSARARPAGWTASTRAGSSSWAPASAATWRCATPPRSARPARRRRHRRPLRPAGLRRAAGR